MEEPNSRTKRARLGGILRLLAIGSGVVVLLCNAFAWDFTSDDAFIVARYARNVVEGNGWVYNVGDRVEGYTSFLWLALTAGLGALGVDYVVALRSLSLLAACGCLVAAGLAAGKSGISPRSPIAWVACLLISTSPAFACWALGGLETCGYALAVLLALLAAVSARPGSARMLLAGVLCGGCVLLRPDGALVPAALALWIAISRRTALLASLRDLLLPCLAIVAVHLLWRHSYYGEWLPNTFYAKVGGNAQQAVRGIGYLAEFVVDQGGLLAWTVPFLAVWLYPSAPLARAASTLALFLVAGVILVGGDGLPMYRFMTPIVPLWALIVQILLHDVWQACRRSAAAEPADAATPHPPVGHSRVSVRRLRVAAGILGTALVAILVAAPWMNLRRTAPFIAYDEQRNLEVPRWAAVGRWLAKIAPPHASLACVPIGAVGYYSNLRVYDMLGLTDRHIAHKDVKIGGGWAGHEKTDGPYILSKMPTYLLLGNIRVLDAQIPPDHPYFLRPPNPFIRAREQDIWTAELMQQYEPRVVALPDGLYLHFLERKR